MSKRYKLLKDLPDAPAGTIFTFTDWGDSEGYLCPTKFGDIWYRKEIVEQSYQWFEELKPERIEVEVDGAFMYQKKHILPIIVPHSYMVDEGVFPEIKAAVESILNGDPVWKWSTEHVIVRTSDKMYTQEQYNKGIEDAFRAARREQCQGNHNFVSAFYALYPSFGSYLKSLTP